MSPRANLNVPNVVLDTTQKELAVGAIAVNPNTSERVYKVLDSRLEAADMKNKFCLKIVLTGNQVTKVLNDNPEFR